MHVLVYICHEELNVGWISDTAGKAVRSMFFKVDQYFDLIIVSAENITLHKHIAQRVRSMFRAISVIVGNPALLLSQKSINSFVNRKVKECLKIRHPNAKMVN